MIRSILAVLICVSGAFAVAAIPPLKFTSLGKPDAPVVGTFNRNAGAEPENLNPISSAEYASTLVQEYVLEGLLMHNSETYEWEPQLAENYEISKDGMTFTFYLRKNTKFSDGKPVTAEDVKFSIDCVKDPAFKASARMPYFEDVESVVAVDPTTVKIKMKKKYYLNLEVLATNPVLPKHIYSDPKKKFDGAPLFGSGPYKVEAYNRGKNIMLVRNPDWWGKDYPDQKAFGKFERVNFRFIKDENLELEMVKKGQIDFMWTIRPDNFEQKAVGDAFGKTILKVEATNKRSKDWGFIAWNQKNILFKDKNVRVALAHLLNRKLLIDKFQFGKAVEAVSPYYYSSPYNPPGLKPVEYNPEQAKALLKKAGWTDKEKKGILQKEIDGKPVEFKFTLLLTRREIEKYFTIYKEDLKKAGIEMEIKLIEWNTFAKLLDEQKFEAVTLMWAGGSLEDDPKQIWHSDSARPGGSNFISYSNKEVDNLIDKSRQEMDKNKRKVMWQKLAKLIADDAPYAFLFNLKYDLYLLNKRIAYDKPTYQYNLSYPYFYLAPL